MWQDSEESCFPSRDMWKKDLESLNIICKVLKGPNGPSSSLHYTNEVNVRTLEVDKPVVLLLPLVHSYCNNFHFADAPLLEL